MLSEEDTLSAEREILARTKGLISAAAALLVWALPLVLIRSDVYADSVIEFSAYLTLAPVLTAASALVYMLAELVCRKIWPELREEHEAAERNLRRLYIGAGCAMALVLMGAFAGLINAGSQVIVEARQTVNVRFDDQEAYRVYIALVNDCELGGSAWVRYCEENLAERGIPWKGEITDVEKDYLVEYGYLPKPEETVDPGFYFWAFCPQTQSVEGLEVGFEFEHYRSGDNEAAFGILLIALLAAAGLCGFVLLRRKYILQADREKRLYEQAMTGLEFGEPEEAQTETEE
jgi:hypothetical protein